MEITLARNSCLNTTLLDSAGTPLFRVNTPCKFFQRTTTAISRATADDTLVSVNSSPASALRKRNGVDSTLTGGSGSHEKLGEKTLASFSELEWRCFSPSTLRYGEAKVNINQYLHPEGCARR